MVNLKLKKSLAKENYVNQLVIKGTCQVKEVVDYENQKTNPQLIQDLMQFIETEINEGKYSKKDSEFEADFSQFTFYIQSIISTVLLALFLMVFVRQQDHLLLLCF